jgi:hypothetical protein
MRGLVILIWMGGVLRHPFYFWRGDYYWMLNLNNKKF